ncbi:MAG: hypothetical protein KH149_03275 [Clostridiales bacterium]|nr:hypothetical protein [Clostridiales bacterium]
METPFLFVEMLPCDGPVSAFSFFAPPPHRHFTKIHLLRMLFAPPRHGILALPGAKKSCRRTAMPSLFP